MEPQHRSQIPLTYRVQNCGGLLTTGNTPGVQCYKYKYKYIYVLYVMISGIFAMCGVDCG